MSDDKQENEKPLEGYMLRNVPNALNKKWDKAKKLMGRSKRIIALDALEEYFDKHGI